MADLVYPPVIFFVKGFWRYLGLRFNFQGQEHIPHEGGAILAINHVGYLDFAIAGTAVLPTKRYVRFMAKKEIFNHKIAGPLMRGMHHINVDRSNGGPSFEAALKALKSGEIIGIFPEATISVSFEIKEIKSGTIRLAIDSGAPVIPTIVWGSQRVITKGLKPNFKRNHFPISVVCGDPIFYPPTANVEQSQLHLRKVMLEMLHEVQNSYPDNHAGQRWAPARLGGTAPAPLN